MSSDRRLLQSRFLDGLTEVARQRVFALTRELSEALGTWVRSYPQLMRAARVPQVCLTMAAAAPFLEVHELLPAARMSLWTFAVDDLCDGGLDAPPPWDRFERSVCLLEGGEGGAGGEEPLELAMRDIAEELAGFPLAAALRPHLVASLREMLRGMWLEAEWSTSHRCSPLAPLPSWHDYLERAARHSIGTLPIYLSVLSTRREPPLLSRLPRLMELGREAALGVRLANDLQGYARERDEGKLGSLVILRREFMVREGLSSEVALLRARAEVKARARGVVERCLAGEGAARDASERIILNALAFACDFYLHHDYHEVLVGQDGQPLATSPQGG